MRFRKFFLLPVFLFLLGLASCDDSFLDKTVTTDLDEDVVFSDSTYATGFLTQIYVDIGFDTDFDRFGNGGLQVACDEAEFKQESSISTGMAFATGTVNPVTVTNDAWEKCYKNIRRCNKFLKMIDRTPMLESTKIQYKAEARFLRSWYYFILLRHYGGIPLIGDTCYNATDQMKSTRDTYADCVDYITSEVEDIISQNVLRPRTTGRSNGRISEAVCRSLLSRLYLYCASPLYNGSGYGTEETQALLGYPTYDKERWYKAYKATKDVMTCGDYALYEVHRNNDTQQDEPGWGYYAIIQPADFVNVTSYGDFTYPYGAYQEHILEKKADAGYGVLQLLCPKTCGGSGKGGYIYYDLCKCYPMKDGKAIDDATGKYKYDPLDPSKNRDPRFFNDVTYNGYVQRNGNNDKYTVQTWTGDPTATTEDEVHKGTPTGFYIHKFINRNCAGNYWAAPPMSRTLIRFAETLLNYAEAANEYYGPDFKETIGEVEMSPYEALRLIRRRAGIEAGADGNYGLKANMTQEEMREAIRLERRVELSFEGFRFFDVRRWMIAEDVENQPMHGLEILITKNGEGKRTLKENEFVVRNHVFRKAMYFFPIPYDETVKTPELIQNPYYE